MPSLAKKNNELNLIGNCLDTLFCNFQIYQTAEARPVSGINHDIQMKFLFQINSRHLQHVDILHQLYVLQSICCKILLVLLTSFR